MAEYDEQDAVEAIRKYIGETSEAKLSEDLIYEVIDLMFDYYESLSDEEDDPMMEVEIDDALRIVNPEVLIPIFDYVKKNISREAKLQSTDKLLEKICEGEILYEISIEEL